MPLNERWTIRTSRRPLAYLLALTAATGLGCPIGPPAVGDTDADPGTSTGDDTADTGTTGGPVSACLDLPAAAAANWQPGEVVEPQGVSTQPRITAAGLQTWDLALTLMRITDTEAHPSVAASPASMSVALGMTYGRYEGQECGDRILDVMGFTEQGADLHDTLGGAVAELHSRALPAGEQGSELGPVVVSMLSSVWRLTPEAPPQGLSAYGAVVHDVIDGDLAAINEVMNCVIEEQTQGLLVEFIPPYLPDSDTTSFEINASYLEAPWSVGLSERSPLSFTRDDGLVVDVDAMTSEFLHARVYESESFLSIDMPLRGEQLSVMFVMPTNGAALADFVESLTTESLLVARDDAQDLDLQLDMPTVDISSTTIDYYDALELECPPFTLRSVLHGAAVQIDEQGVKAAAAAANENWDSGGELPELAYVLDHPFLFFVYDSGTDFVLYNGRYAGD